MRHANVLKHHSLAARANEVQEKRGTDLYSKRGFHSEILPPLLNLLTVKVLDLRLSYSAAMASGNT